MICSAQRIYKGRPRPTTQFKGTKSKPPQSQATFAHSLNIRYVSPTRGITRGCFCSPCSRPTGHNTEHQIILCGQPGTSWSSTAFGSDPVGEDLRQVCKRWCCRASRCQSRCCCCSVRICICQPATGLSNRHTPSVFRLQLILTSL